MYMYTRKRGINTGHNRTSKAAPKHVSRPHSPNTQLYSYKGALRGGLIYYSCRISLFSRMVMDNLLGTGKDTHKAIQDVITLLLKDENMFSFISRNRGDVFTQNQRKTADGFLDYDVSKTIAKVEQDLRAEYRKTHRSSRSRSMPQRARFRRLFPFVFMEKNWNIPHYFILYYEDGKWYIYSSYSSDYVRIGVAKIEIDLSLFIQFMRCMYTYPRSPAEDTFMKEFFRTFFLANPTQQIVCTENSKGNDMRFMPNKQKGVNKEIDLYDTSIMLVYVPEFKECLDELMERNAEVIQSILAPAGLSLKPSFLVQASISISSAGSMTDVAVTPGRRTRTSGP